MCAKSQLDCCECAVFQACMRLLCALARHFRITCRTTDIVLAIQDKSQTKDSVQGNVIQAGTQLCLHVQEVIAETARRALQVSQRQAALAASQFLGRSAGL